MKLMVSICMDSQIRWSSCIHGLEILVFMSGDPWTLDIVMFLSHTLSCWLDDLIHGF